MAVGKLIETGFAQGLRAGQFAGFPAVGNVVGPVEVGIVEW